jgi:hypothetical protein
MPSGSYLNHVFSHGGFSGQTACGRRESCHKLQVPFAGDQHPVQALVAGTGDPAFGYSIRARRLDRSLHDPHADRDGAVPLDDFRGLTVAQTCDRSAVEVETALGAAVRDAESTVPGCDQAGALLNRKVIGLGSTAATGFLAVRHEPRVLLIDPRRRGGDSLSPGPRWRAAYTLGHGACRAGGRAR